MSQTLLLQPNHASAAIASTFSKSVTLHSCATHIRPRNANAPLKLVKKEKIDVTRIITVKSTKEGINYGLLAGDDAPEKTVYIPARYKVATLTALVMCLCNADRVVMSVAVVPLAASHQWSNAFLGIVQSSFLWGYFFSSLIGGALVDKYGGKKVMAWGVALWSMATLLTPGAASHSTACLLGVRAFFGLAEGVAMPSMCSLLTKWFPSDERSSAVGFSMAGFHLGNVAGLLLSPLLIAASGIRGPFLLFSSVGFLWLYPWSRYVTKEPRLSPHITKYELRLIESTGIKSHAPNDQPPPVRLLFSKPAVWAIIFANITNNWGYFVLLSWMPTYFSTVFNVNVKQAAWFSALPWCTMAVWGFIAGASSDLLIRKGVSLTIVRKIMQSIGFFGTGISLLCLNSAKTPVSAAACMAMALSLSSFSQAGFLLNIHDIAPQYAGFLLGASNAAGTLAAIASTIGVGFFVELLGSFQSFLTLTSSLYFISAIFWNIYSTGERLV